MYKPQLQEAECDIRLACDPFEVAYIYNRVPLVFFTIDSIEPLYLFSVSGLEMHFGAKSLLGYVPSSGEPLEQCCPEHH